jgi:UDP-GlcNAc3NAcA epimerase
MRIATIVGARPQFVKAAMVSNALANYPTVQEVWIHTGQHFDDNMSDVFFRQLSLAKPKYHLGIHSLSHGAMTGRMLDRIEEVLKSESPDVVIVYGDTDSTLAGALAAAKLQIPVAHVEAGLRAFKKSIPEEINRVLTDHISTYLFTPTKQADQNLLKEGIDQHKIHNVGDVMYDAALHYSPSSNSDASILKENALKSKDYVLATVHRPYHTDEKNALQEVCSLLDLISKDIQVVWPVHPRATKQMNAFGIKPQHVKCIDAVGYIDMLVLEKNAALIITDSGGVQKEAYFQRVPCVTLREETEWVELVENGWNALITPTGDLPAKASVILQRRNVPGKDVVLYGSGHAADSIARILVKATR